MAACCALSKQWRNWAVQLNGSMLRSIQTVEKLGCLASWQHAALCPNSGEIGLSSFMAAPLSIFKVACSVLTRGVPLHTHTLYSPGVSPYTPTHCTHQGCPLTHPHTVLTRGVPLHTHTLYSPGVSPYTPTHCTHQGCPLIHPHTVLTRGVPLHTHTLYSPGVSPYTPTHCTHQGCPLTHPHTVLSRGIPLHTHTLYSPGNPV